MREIVLDTETTGISHQDGHRIVEVGAIVTINRVPQLGKEHTFHFYINPERDIPQEVVNIHGITNEKVKDCPFFADIADDFLNFIADSPIVAHNASFDIGHLNAELERAGKQTITNEIIDTLEIARAKYPGARVTLDALCQRFEIDATERTLHGALLDAKLLGDVYLEMMGGKQPDLMEDEEAHALDDANFPKTMAKPAREFPLTAEEQKNFDEFIATIEDPLWLKN